MLARFYWQTQMEGGTGAGAAGHFQRAAGQAGALAHPQQAVVAGPFRGCGSLRIEPHPVILQEEVETFAILSQAQAHLGGVGVAGGVGQPLGQDPQAGLQGGSCRQR